MMRTVGAYDAKTNLGRLLEEVAAGETIVITKHGLPVAKLVPATAPRRHTEDVIRDLKDLRRQVQPLGDLSVRDLIDEGRTY